MKSFVFYLLLLPSIIFTQNSDWAYRNPYPQNDFFAIKFFDQNTGYVIGSGGIFMKNITGSNNWINMPYFTNRDLYAMYFFDINTGYIVGDDGHIFYTSTGGISWTSVVTNNGHPLRSITFINQNTGFTVGDNGELYKTTSGITGWQYSGVTTSNLRSVYFYDSLNGFVCGDSGRVLKTTNCGANWSIQTVGTAKLNSISFINNLTGFLTSGTYDLLKTTDGGNSWNSYTAFLQGTDNFVKFANSNTGFIYGKNGPLSRTTNGGINWNTWCSTQLFSGNSYYDISHVDSSTSYVCGSGGWIMRCYNIQPQNTQYAEYIGGTKTNLSCISFTSAQYGGVIGTEGSLLFITSNGGDKWNISFRGSNSWFEGATSVTRMWAFTPASWYLKVYSPGIGGFSSTGLMHSTDGGITWSGNRGYNTYSMGIANIDVFEIGGISYLTSNSSILKNSGTGWSTIYSGTATGNLYFADINTGFVAAYNSGIKSILYTSNGGANWITYSTGSTKPIESVYLSSSGLGFAGCDSSLLLKTTNFGMNWQQISVPNNLHIQNIKFINDYTGWFMATDHNYNSTGRLYVSNNGGSNFQQMQSLMNFNVKGYSFVDSQNGYVCGDSGMVLKTTNGGLTFVTQNTGLLPDKFSLSQNYPNPFNPVTNIKFNIPLLRGVPEGRGVLVKLIIYDIMGREITQLINRQMQPGSYNVDWDATTYPSGVYFYKLETGDFNDSKRMVLIK